MGEDRRRWHRKIVNIAAVPFCCCLPLATFPSNLLQPPTSSFFFQFCLMIIISHWMNNIPISSLLKFQDVLNSFTLYYSAPCTTPRPYPKYDWHLGTGLIFIEDEPIKRSTLKNTRSPGPLHHLQTSVTVTGRLNYWHNWANIQAIGGRQGAECRETQGHTSMEVVQCIK